MTLYVLRNPSLVENGISILRITYRNNVKHDRTEQWNHRVCMLLHHGLFSFLSSSTIRGKKQKMQHSLFINLNMPLQTPPVTKSAWQFSYATVFKYFRVSSHRNDQFPTRDLHSLAKLSSWLPLASYHLQQIFSVQNDNTDVSSSYPHVVTE